MLNKSSIEISLIFFYYYRKVIAPTISFPQIEKFFYGGIFFFPLDTLYIKYNYIYKAVIIFFLRRTASSVISGS